ncbi:MAG: 1-deoxy-D-xylulose-5-phosphate reductoisomerase [Acidimicrobiales bacterium]
MSDQLRVSIAGSTGSIGTQTLDVVSAAPDRFEVVAIGAGSDVEGLAKQACELGPEIVAIADSSLAGRLETMVPAGTEVRAGGEALGSLAEVADVVVNGVVGFAGLGVTVEALRSGRRLALANKESLVAGAPVVRRVSQTDGAEIIPVDSEHCAIHQCLGDRTESDVSRLVLTASGGPFRGRVLKDLLAVTVSQALAHPTWQMGPKISVDSSTLMNKGLEVLEAHELFGVGFDRVEVVVHPQSVIHSMVEFNDGAILAQLSRPDMRLPIGYAMGYPRRMQVPYGALDLSTLSTLDFEPPDLQTFRCLALAYEAGRIGGSAPCWLNAANEVAVAAFLAGSLAWQAIPAVVEMTLEAHEATELASVEDVIAADRRARERAGEHVAAYPSS